MARTAKSGWALCSSRWVAGEAAGGAGKLAIAAEAVRSESEGHLDPVRQQVGGRLQLMGVGDVELYNYAAVLLTAPVTNQSGANGRVRVPTTSESAQRLVATSFSLHQA